MGTNKFLHLFPKLKQALRMEIFGYLIVSEVRLSIAMTLG